MSRTSLMASGRVAARFLAGMTGEVLSQSWRSTFGRPHPFARRPDPETVRYKASIRAPWPQPNPHAPDELAATVLHLPAEELKEFRRVTIARLTRTLRESWPDALRFASAETETPAVSDDLLIRWMTESLFCRSMTTELDAADRSLLGPMDGGGVLYKQDLRVIGKMKTVPGTYVSGPTLFTRRPDSSARCVPVGIAFPRDDASGPLLVRPEDGAAWELSKHHMVLAACYEGLFGSHPLVHFPVDAINALTKTILPREHLVSRLLMPHLYIQLCLNFSVWFIDKSPLHNEQSLLFTGLTNDGVDGALSIATSTYVGIEGHPGCPGYAWDPEPEVLHSDYGAFLAGYHRIILDFVTEVVAGINLRDPDLQRWWRACGTHVRGFPDEAALHETGELERVLAFLIHNAAIVHSVDHHSFGTLPLLPHMLRIRVPAPTSRSIPPLDRSRFTTLEDRFRMFFTHAMHIRPNTERRLLDVDYGFEAPHHQGAQRRFFERLRAYDADPGVTRHAPLDSLACSIQY